jgi:prepilin signal peptidase PulO-like enzyme (type II secretory pathway)
MIMPIMIILILAAFLTIIGWIFGAGLRILGWIFSGLGFLISLFLAVSAVGIAFNLLPIILVVGVIMIARSTV